MSNEFQKAKRDFLRMSHVLLMAFTFYLIASITAGVGMTFFPQLQTVCWKLGHITMGAYVGYWIDRHTFQDRFNNTSDVATPPLLHVRRAIVMVGAMIAVALGM